MIVCVQNKITNENMRTLIALVNTCLTFLIRTTDVVNGIHCIKDAKVSKFYVYKFMYNLSIAKIYEIYFSVVVCLCIFVYSGVQKIKI